MPSRNHEVPTLNRNIKKLVLGEERIFEEGSMVTVEDRDPFRKHPVVHARIQGFNVCVSRNDINFPSK